MNVRVSREYREANGLTPERIADTMRVFYEKLDALSAGIEARLESQGMKLACRAGCCGCCRDDLTITRVEAAVIRRLFPGIGSQEPHPPGACAFLDDAGRCRIYPARPYICRTHGLPMRLTVDKTEAVSMGIVAPGDVPDGAELELRDICDLSRDSVDVDSLSEDACWSPDVAEMQLSMMEMCTFGEGERVPMREMFGSEDGAAQSRST